MMGWLLFFVSCTYHIIFSLSFRSMQSTMSTHISLECSPKRRIKGNRQMHSGRWERMHENLNLLGHVEGVSGWSEQEAPSSLRFPFCTRLFSVHCETHTRRRLSAHFAKKWATVLEMRWVVIFFALFPWGGGVEYLYIWSKRRGEWQLLFFTTRPS